MRSRSNSGVKLDNYARLIQKTILKHQDPITGLFSAASGEPHSWVRDNLYTIQAVWGLALAYRKHADLDEDRAKCYEMEQNVVKCMRSLLQCMMGQVEKLEKFKHSQSPVDALHAKYNKRTCGTVVGDHEWGHLQLDATGLYILMLAQMITSGLDIIYSLDEVVFIQNLVFYISSAYCTPDYGIWERGDKTNHGVPELNATSVGMCKAALEAIDGMNLFGPDGGPPSVIHVTPDEKAMCQAILQSMLPRESNSKEVDAGLLSILTYPAFAVTDQNLVDTTKQAIVDKLQGRFGCSRFLRDGFKTAREDTSRLYYELPELKMFDNIECEWPLFWTYFILDGLFQDNLEQVEEYRDALKDILVVQDGSYCVPELYSVPEQLVDLEKSAPHSQDRVPLGKIPHLWSQSLYILGLLMSDGYLNKGEIDPLNRRFATRPKEEVVVQMVLLAEEDMYSSMLKQEFNIHVETFKQLSSVRLQPEIVLSHIYSFLGKCPKQKLSGRPHNRIGILGTSKLYVIKDKTYLFTPQVFDQVNFYTSLDTDMLIDLFITELQYLVSSWKSLGRPLVAFPIHRGMLSNKGTTFKPCLLTALRKIQSGYLNGVRVVLDTVTNFLSTSCLTKLTFLEETGRIYTDDAISQIERTLNLPYESRWHKLHKHTALIHPTSDADPTTVGKETTPSPATQHDVSSSAEWKSSGEKREFLQGVLTELRRSEDLKDQAEVISKLCKVKFPRGTNLDLRANSDSNNDSLSDIVEELYERAGQKDHWRLVRQVTGLLNKRVVGLAESVTDLVVRQKQITIGLPHEDKELTITAPLPLDEICAIISKALNDDYEMSVLTQEIIVYLAMFIRSIPSLFADLLRLRVGLIIKVMTSELALNLRCSSTEAHYHLTNLSPFEMKQLVHNILSGKEFELVKSVGKFGQEYSLRSDVSVKRNDVLNSIKNSLRRSGSAASRNCSTANISIKTASSAFNKSDECSMNHGQWLRRRRIDGALNRVPENFYSRIWFLLENCYGIVIGGHHIPGLVTKEMTAGELKFAVLVENIFNNIPQPEYRQLMVECLMVLTILVDPFKTNFISENLDIDEIVKRANQIFYQQEMNDGASADMLQRDPNTDICLEFYDTAPSGSHGTVTYLSKAVGEVFRHYFPENVADCTPS